MKAIDLLVKIANGEEVPERIIFYYNEFYYDKANLKYRNIDEDKDNLFKHLDFYKGTVLNDEVEIIEDTPKEDNIKKISVLNTDSYVEDVYYGNLSKEEICLDIQSLKHKINEIIEKVNGK